MNKKKNRFRHLLLIPIQLVLDIVLLALAAVLDQKIVDPNAMGHPMPVFTLIGAVVLAVITVIVVIVSIIKTIKGK